MSVHVPPQGPGPGVRTELALGSVWRMGARASGFWLNSKRKCLGKCLANCLPWLHLEGGVQGTDLGVGCCTWQERGGLAIGGLHVEVGVSCSRYQFNSQGDASK